MIRLITKCLYYCELELGSTRNAFMFTCVRGKTQIQRHSEKPLGHFFLVLKHSIPNQRKTLNF